MGYNKAENPWLNVNTKINEYTDVPKWVKLDYYENYNCIDRLIIVAARNKYDKSGWKQHRYVTIKNYVIDFDNMIQV